MVKFVACLTLLAVVGLAANHPPRHEGHDHGSTSVSDGAAAETSASHNHHEEPTASMTGVVAESTGHSHGADHEHGDESSTDTSGPAESTDPLTVSAASTADLTWSAAVGLIAYIGTLA